MLVEEDIVYEFIELSEAVIKLDTEAVELLETRGFISIITILPSSGLTANCTFDPPVSTPISLITAIAASRIF